MPGPTEGGLLQSGDAGQPASLLPRLVGMEVGYLDAGSAAFADNPGLEVANRFADALIVPRRAGGRAPSEPSAESR